MYRDQKAMNVFLIIFFALTISTMLFAIIVNPMSAGALAVVFAVNVVLALISTLFIELVY